MATASATAPTAAGGRSATSSSTALSGAVIGHKVMSSVRVKRFGPSRHRRRSVDHLHLAERRR
jgi:hypothetical protein